MWYFVRHRGGGFQFFYYLCAVYTQCGLLNSAFDVGFHLETFTVWFLHRTFKKRAQQFFYHQYDCRSFRLSLFRMAYFCQLFTGFQSSQWDLPWMVSYFSYKKEHFIILRRVPGFRHKLRAQNFSLYSTSISHLKRWTVSVSDEDSWYCWCRLCKHCNLICGVWKGGRSSKGWGSW
jgi:hypothetical protein